MRVIPLIALLVTLEGGVKIQLDPKQAPAVVRIVVEHEESGTRVGQDKRTYHNARKLTADLELEETKDGPGIVVTLRRFYQRLGDGHDPPVDTEKDDPSEPARFFKSLMGVPLRVQPGASRGTDIEGLSDLVAKAMKGTSMKAQDARVVEEFLGGVILQDLLPLVAMHPPGAVEVGKPWSHKVDNGPPYPVRGQCDWVLKSHEKGRMQLQLKGRLEAAPPPKVEKGQRALAIQLKGTLEGELTLDAASGWPLAGSFRRTLTGTYGILGLRAPKPTDDMNVDVVSKYTLEPAEK